MQCLRLQTQHPNASLLYLGISTMSLQLYQHSSREFRTLDLLYAEGCLVPVPNKACPGISNSYKQVVLPADQLPGEAGSLWHLFKASLDPPLQFAKLHVSLCDAHHGGITGTSPPSVHSLHFRLQAELQVLLPAVVVHEHGRLLHQYGGDPPAANTDRTKELVVDLCRQKRLEM